MSVSVFDISDGYRGELPPARFNMARYCLAASAADAPEKVALIVVSDADAPLVAAERWTYGALDDAVRRVAGGLLAEGFGPGERLMIRMPNTSDYALLFFGAIAAGLVPLPSSSQLTDSEAEFLLVDSAAAAVAIAGEMSIDAKGARIIDEAMVARLKAHAPLADYVDTAADDPAFLVYTSGTSGKPKGVLHAQRSAWGRRPMYQGWYGISSADTVLHAGAFNWTYTLGVGLTDPWANGATTVLYNGEKDVQVWPKLLERTGATLFAAVPTLYRQILKYCDLEAHDLSELRHGLTAGEALSSTLLDHWREATGKELYEALGMSECSTYISTAPGMEIRVGSPGRPQPGRCVVALPLDGGEEPVSQGETGLLAVHRSDPGLMLGYWRRLEEEKDVYRGEWFIGGDLASFDADGYVWFHGRADDVMNAMGYRVSPQEVEAALSQHPAIAEVAVTEIHVREDVSVIAAFVVLKEGQRADASSVLDFGEGRLAAYKRPREVIFVDHLPRTPNGKVTRRALAQR
jgi:acyl-coenzyme A synthetase/AMP-(fatty) acid ligase